MVSPYTIDIPDERLAAIMAKVRSYDWSQFPDAGGRSLCCSGATGADVGRPTSLHHHGIGRKALKSELSASEARRVAVTAQGFNALSRRGIVGAAQLRKSIDPLLSTLHVGTQPASAELAPSQTEMALYE